MEKYTEKKRQSAQLERERIRESVLLETVRTTNRRQKEKVKESTQLEGESEKVTFAKDCLKDGQKKEQIESLRVRFAGNCEEDKQKSNRRKKKARGRNDWASFDKEYVQRKKEREKESGGQKEREVWGGSREQVSFKKGNSCFCA